MEIFKCSSGSELTQFKKNSEECQYMRISVYIFRKLQSLDRSLMLPIRIYFAVKI